MSSGRPAGAGRERHTATVTRYVNPYLGNQRIDALTVADMRRRLHRLSTGCQCCPQGKDALRSLDRQRCCVLSRCCGQRLSTRMVLDAHAVHRSALSEAVADRLISHNPAAVVRLAPARPRRMSAWTAEQARQFLTSARDEHDPHYPAYVLLLCLGLRRGELLGLHWDDINLDAATVHVHRELQRVGGQLLLSETKTLDSDAGLPLPALCLAALRAHRSVRARDLAEGALPGGGFVISTRAGGPVDPRNLYRSFQQRISKSDVPRIPLHGARHTCASLLVELEVHPRVAIQILRHAKIATTMDICSHVPTAASRCALVAVSRVLDAVAESTPRGSGASWVTTMS